MNTIQKKKLKTIIESCKTKEHFEAIDNILDFRDDVPIRLQILSVLLYIKTKKPKKQKRRTRIVNTNHINHGKYIRKIIMNYFNMNEEGFRKSSKEGLFVRPRQIACKIINEQTKLRLKEIANLVGYESHSNVCHSIQALNDYLIQDKGLMDDYQNILDKI